MNTINKKLIAILSILCLVCVTVSLVACKSVKCTVTYDLGEYIGEGTAPEAQAVEENTEIILPQVRVTWQDHEFVGWKVGDDILSAGASYTVTADVTFVAQWKDANAPSVPVKYTVTFDLGVYDGNGTAPASQTVEENTEIILPQVGVTWTGYVFTGWEIGSYILNAGENYTVTANVTAVAQWEESGIQPTTYTVTFDLGVYDGNGTAPTSQTVAANTTITLPQVGVTWEGYVFTGWEIGKNIVQAGESYTVTANVTFVAHWEEKASDLDWTPFVGLYVGLYDGSRYVVQISPTDVSVTINGTPANVTFEFRANIYDTYQFDVTINGEIYSVVRADTATDPTVQVPAIMLYYSQDVYFSLLRVESANDCPWQYLIGTFKGEEIVSGDEYAVEITATGVTVTVNGVSANVVLLDYNPYAEYDFVLMINGVEFFLMDYNHQVPGKSLLLQTSDVSSAMALLERVQSDDGPGKEDPDKDNARSPIFDQAYAGKWHGTNEMLGSESFVVEIETNAIYVAVNGSERIRAWIVSYVGELSNDVYFTLGDDTVYELAVMYDSLLLANEDNSVMVMLEREKESGGNNPGEWNDNAKNPIFNMDYAGKWQGLDNNDDIWLVEIETNAIYVTVNSGTRVRAWVTSYEFDMTDYINFTLEGLGGTFSMNPVYRDGILRVYGGSDNLDFTLEKFSDSGNQPNPTTYTVTFNLGEYNGLGSAPQAQTVEKNSTITLPQVGVTWEGYKFTGWKIGAQTFDAGATYTVTVDVTAVAQWTKVQGTEPVGPSNMYKGSYVYDNAVAYLGFKIDKDAKTVTYYYTTKDNDIVVHSVANLTDPLMDTWHPTFGYEGNESDYTYYYAYLNNGQSGTKQFGFWIANDCSVCYLCNSSNDNIVATFTATNSLNDLTPPDFDNDNDQDGPGGGDSGSTDNAMSPIFDQEYLGKWQGVDKYDNITYLVEIERDAIYVTINGGERTRAWITRYYTTGLNDDIYFTVGDSNIEYELYTYIREHTLVLLPNYVDLTPVQDGNSAGNNNDDNSTVTYTGSYTADGYALDYAERYRNLSYVGVLKREIYENKD